MEMNHFNIWSNAPAKLNQFLSTSPTGQCNILKYHVILLITGTGTVPAKVENKGCIHALS
jgi:hypothetical protein